VVYAHAYASAGFAWTSVQVEARCKAPSPWERNCLKSSSGFGSRSRYCSVSFSSCYAYAYAYAAPRWNISLSVGAQNGGFAGSLRRIDRTDEPSIEEPPSPPSSPLAEVKVTDASYEKDKGELTFVLTGKVVRDIMGKTDETGYFNLRVFETDSWDNLDRELKNAKILEQGKIGFSRRTDGTSEAKGEGILEDISLDTDKGSFSKRITIHFSGEQDNLGISVDNHGESEPLLVNLNSFMATPLGDRVLVEWETGAEPDSLGFYLWRGTPINGECTSNIADYMDITLLNKPDSDLRLFSNDGSNTGGEHYFHVDYNIVPNITYCYLLQDVNSNGITTEYWNYMDSVTVVNQENTCN
jgi:hypothetical protein